MMMDCHCCCVKQDKTAKDVVSDDSHLVAKVRDLVVSRGSLETTTRPSWDSAPRDERKEDTDETPSSSATPSSDDTDEILQSAVDESFSEEDEWHDADGRGGGAPPSPEGSEDWHDAQS